MMDLVKYLNKSKSSTFQTIFCAVSVLSSFHLLISSEGEFVGDIREVHSQCVEVSSGHREA